MNHRGCLHRSKFFPPEDPLACRQAPGPKVSQQCCGNADFCNAPLQPQLVVAPSNTSEGYSGKRVTPPRVAM